MSYKNLKTKTLEKLLKRYEDQFEYWEKQGAVVTMSPRCNEDLYIITINRIFGMISKELQRRELEKESE